jgi:hypothetical protein
MIDAQSSGDHAMTMRWAVLLLGTLCSACSEMPRAWERGHLAAPEMAWETDALLAAQADHTYVSKEAAAGGAGVGGGGCGCN